MSPRPSRSARAESSGATLVTSRMRVVPLCVAVVAGGVVGGVVAAAGTQREETFWFVVLLTAWIVGTVLALLQPRPSLAFVALQAWMALNVLNGAVLAMIDGTTTIGQYDFTDGLAGGMRISAMAEIGVVAGMLLMRAAHPAGPRRRPTQTVPSGVLDRWSIAFLAAGAGSLLLYVVLSGSGLSSINVLGGANVYGDLKQNADGTLIGYLKVFTGLAGVGMMLATMRLMIASRRRPVVPAVVLGVGSVLLVSSGGRSWLLVPAVTCGLLWWKSTPSVWSRRPRRLVIAGGLAIFAVAAIVGGLRGQEGEKVVDAEAFATKELRGGIFPTTAGLASSIPDQQPYVHGRSFLEAGTLVVPRALWPEKPTSVLKEVQDGFMPQDIGASFGLQGELYANAGLVGVLVGAALFAALLEWSWLRLTEVTRVASMLCFAALVPILIHLFSRGYVVVMLAGQLGTIVGVAIAARSLHRWATTPAPSALARTSG